MTIRRTSLMLKSILIFCLVMMLATPCLAAKKRKKKAPSPHAKVLGQIDRMIGELQFFQAEPLKRSIGNLARRYEDEYKNAEQYLAQIPGLETKRDALIAKLTELRKNPAKFAGQSAPVIAGVEEIALFQRKALVIDNPKINFDEILFVDRKQLGLPANWQGNSSVCNKPYDARIAAVNIKAAKPTVRTVYKPADRTYIADVDLHFDADKLMFSGKGKIFEVKIDGSGLRDVIKGTDSYDPLYLPNGQIIFDSESGYQGVPCVGGKSYVGNLHLANADGSGIRRLCFDQDNDWCPTLMENGRVMYTRWEYTDSAHYFSRILMNMNPDGTNQVAFYGSNSYWPNSMFYCRPIPGKRTQFVAIVSGHHGVRRMGELVLFDVSRGRFEAEGAIQRIPGYGKKVKAITQDRLVDKSWPLFLHPFPLDKKYFLVAGNLSKDKSNNWSLYLVDIYDNIVPLLNLPDTNCFEPIPLRKRTKPPIVPTRVRPAIKTSRVILQDVYEGAAMRGVPRGVVKSMRILQYEYAYRRTGGHYVIGFEGPWDVRRLLGTVPVYEDGSASFEIPANTPVALQPLDAEGKAVAIMRSWFVGMPGETISCVGCHENQNMTPIVKRNKASQTAPVKPKSWYGPTRGFSFRREIQPVLNKYCIGCHDGKKKGRPIFTDTGLMKAGGQSQYSQAYISLHPYTRRNGPEGDYHVLTPLEFHADTSELIQILRKGHYGVKLDAEAWDRFITWIDVNVPFHGTWLEAAGPKLSPEFIKARAEYKKKYAGINENVEAPTRGTAPEKVAFVKPAKPPKYNDKLSAKDWPFDAATAKKMQGSDRFDLDLGDGQKLTFVRIPAGEYVMGSKDGYPDEHPRAVVRIEKPFWMAKTEISNKQYNLFDPEHDSGVYDKHYKDQVNRGYFVNGPELPVIRVSFNRAMEFCGWLNSKLSGTKLDGKHATIPTEAQWEWACRAGTSTSMNYGDLNADFSTKANLADISMKLTAVRGVDPKPVKNPSATWAYELHVSNSDDKVLHLAKPGSYSPNAFGLFDMHGNVAEWTRSSYKPYPYKADDGRNDTTDKMARKVVRGGSWKDVPRRGSSSYRWGYPAWQRVFNVGIRVIIEE